jgi:phosphatidate cytidylyltransferase
VDTDLSRRLATAVIGIPLLVLLIGWAPSWLFSGIFFLLTVAALREYFAMAFPQSWQDQCMGIAFGTAISCAVFLNEGLDAATWLSAVLLIGFAAYLFTAGKPVERLNRLLFTLLGGFYIGYLFPQWVLLFRQPHGRAWVFWVLLVVMVGDTVAYFAGRTFGTRKLAPEISPGKTVEGAYGYVAGAIVAGLIGATFLFEQILWPEIFALSLATSILGQIGDLFESWIKRAFAVKDSGNLLPGHGGLLDRLDSLIFPAVFTTTYLRVFHS